MSRTLLGTGNVVSGQVDILAAPLLAYAEPGTVPGVIYCHGATKIATDQTHPTIAPGEYPIFDALRQRYCVGMGDFEFTAWGNNATIADILAMQTYLQSSPVDLVKPQAKSGKIAIGGASMGVTNSLNYARAYPDNVACVFGFIPAVNPPSNPGFASTLNAAYPPVYDDSVWGSTNNPTDFAASFPDDIPVHLWYSTGDTVAYPQWAQKFAATCPSATATRVSTTTDHNQTTIALVPVADVLAFIAANLS